jgi:hypothetical protein
MPDSLDVGSIDPTSPDRDHRRQATKFFWAVLSVASSASIGGNAAHALVATDLTVPAQLAAAVAVAPPIILMLSIEGLSLLIRSGRRSTFTFWSTLVMTALLATFAFILSFEALRDLAIRCGISNPLACLWPLIVDVTIAQATLALVALSRAAVAQVNEFECELNDDALDGELAEDGGDHAQRALAVARSTRIRQTPEKIQSVLSLKASGAKASEIAEATKLHHSTVTRILVEDARARTGRVATNGAQQHDDRPDPELVTQVP